MGKRDVDDFPFAYLADKQSPNQGRRPESGGRSDGARNVRRPASREIEKLLIISIVMTVLFLILLTASIVVGLKNRDEEQAQATQTSLIPNSGSELSSEASGQDSLNGEATQMTEGAEQTQLSVIHIE